MKHTLICTAMAAGCLQATLAGAAPQTINLITFGGDAVANAAVSIQVKGAPRTAPASASASADMGQRQRSFVPGLLVVQTGTSVNFPNFDTVRHHVYSFSPTKTFEIKLYAGTPAKPVVFDKAGTATLGCNIHDRMIAHIHVVDTPYFGVTDGMGRVTIDLPAGDHVARIECADIVGLAPAPGTMARVEATRTSQGSPSSDRVWGMNP